MIHKFFPIVIAVLIFLGCAELFPPQEPTRTRMQGLWEVVEVYDEDGETENKDGRRYIDQISFPVTAFHFSSDNSVTSTAGPMIMYLVYGSSNYTRIASQVDQVFNYANLNVNGGEWFIGSGNVDRFTLEMRLEGLPGQTSITSLLSMLNVTHIHTVIYHKFMDIKVTFDTWDDSIMYWEFDDQTFAEYNTKDEYGRDVLWRGWPAENFSRGRFELRKRSGDITDLIK
ncbi:hypothetical protein QA601_12205 [Chitinispirillales bacterium ANBcel5]|uniref:hypothetical protein n=1 Tax=Cellulosispirillum alkaliphilum TaxID=3039283 RepID=UPI002A534D64|nr:hypothetical protein [Chitinispirillales bacterium ANBcel5]